MSYQYEFSICAIFRNEATILKQWIEHHLLFGCEHFYLINNDSSDNYKTILLPYIDHGLVDLVDEPGNYRQYFAYNRHYLELICRETRWIGIIDIDEYLYPRKGGSDIKQILAAYDGVDSLAVPWLLFGSSGLIKQPEHIINSFIFRQDYDSIGWTSFKTIVRTDALAQSFLHKQESWDQFIFGVHSHRLKPGKKFSPTFLPKDTELLGDPLPYCYYFREVNLKSARLVINHYRTMSREYYQQVMMKRPSATTPAYDINEGDMTYFNNYDTNEIKDETLKNFTRAQIVNCTKS